MGRQHSAIGVVPVAKSKAAVLTFLALSAAVARFADAATGARVALRPVHTVALVSAVRTVESLRTR